MRFGFVSGSAAGLVLSLFCIMPATAQQSVAARSGALSALFHEMWEDRLAHSPEFASSLGDRRYNDQLSDLSPRARNAELERERGFLARLVVIDTTGLSTQEKLSAELMERRLIEEEEASKFKEWVRPESRPDDCPAWSRDRTCRPIGSTLGGQAER